MARKCSAEKQDKFQLVDDDIIAIYSSHVNLFSSGGAYVPIPKEYDGKKVYVVIRK